MTIQFAIDDVKPAEDRLQTEPLASLLGDVLAVGGDPNTPIIPIASHAVLGAVHQAFADHRPLALSPDAIWLTLAAGFAQHIRLNADTLRSRLVRHEERKRLEVGWSSSMPTDAESWRQIVALFHDRLAEELGDGPTRLFACDFTTSSAIDRVAGQITLMDAYSPYYDYTLMCVCGIPKITLLGTAEDWRNIRARVDVLAEFDLAFWTKPLAIICDEFVRAAEGRPNLSFWKSIYKPKLAYGGDVVTGWIGKLYPYVKSDGSYALRNPMLSRSKASIDSGIQTGDVPGGPSVANVRVHDISGTVVDVSLEAHLSVTQQLDGTLMPFASWCLRRGTTIAIEDVLARIQNEHRVSPPVRAIEDPLTSLPTDLRVLFDQIGSATLFADQNWHLRAVAEQDLIDVVVGPNRQNPRVNRSVGIRRLLDLPDGTAIALVNSGEAPLYVLCDTTQLGELERTEHGQDRRASRQNIEEIQVAGKSFTELLGLVLDSHGRLELPNLGGLRTFLPSWF